RGRAEGLQLRPPGALLEKTSGQVRDCPGQGQEGLRQARQREGQGLGSREAKAGTRSQPLSAAAVRRGTFPVEWCLIHRATQVPRVLGPIRIRRRLQSLRGMPSWYQN